MPEGTIIYMGDTTTNNSMLWMKKVRSDTTTYSLVWTNVSYSVSKRLFLVENFGEKVLHAIIH